MALVCEESVSGVTVGTAPTPTDVPNRLRGWATFGLPHSLVFSPSIDWRTGFPYSALDVYRHYVGTPYSQRFPNYFTVDVTVYKTFDLKERKADLGLQFFNVTSHFNPRDVIPVTESSQFGSFTNSFGVTLGAIALRHRDRFQHRLDFLALLFEPRR